MTNKFLLIAFCMALSAFFAMTIVDAKDAQEFKERREILGKPVGRFCGLTKEAGCFLIAEKEELPLKIEMPLGRHILTQESEILCLARNITQEAQSNKEDMIFVGWGTVNRVKYGYGKTICEVISASKYSAKHKKIIYQMSWYGNDFKRRMSPSKKAIQIAKDILAGQIPNPAPTCQITNWYNRVLDGKGTHNDICLMKHKACSISNKGANHIYIGVPYGKC